MNASFIKTQYNLTASAEHHCRRSLSLYLLFTLAIMCVVPFIGSESLSIKNIISNLTARQGTWDIDTEIFIYQRIPRVLLGFLVGGSLALVGSVFQVILRNPLATPYTLGITGGGSVGAVLAITVPQLAVHWGPFSSTQLLALAGAMITTALIYIMARRATGISMNTLLLAGVTIGILCSALILLIRYLTSPHLLVSMDRWMMGGLDILGYRTLASLAPLLLPGIAILFAQTNSLNHLALGKEMAMGHGIDVGSVQTWSFAAGSLTTAAAVSAAGPIAFVGLLVPHAVRMISGYDHRIILPAAFMSGGAFLTICDTVARTAVAPTEMPVGIITALIGAPFFIYLLLKKSTL